MALPEAACRQVYATEVYRQSLQNLSQTSLATDMVFSDGYSLQLGTVTGSVDQGHDGQPQRPGVAAPAAGRPGAFAGVPC